MMRVKPTTHHAARIDNSHSTRFTMLLIHRTLRCIWHKAGYGVQS